MSEPAPAPDAWIPTIQHSMKHEEDTSNADVLREILHELRELNARSRKASEDKTDPSGDPIQDQTFTTFTAALAAYVNRPGRLNDLASLSTISVFVAGLSAALLAYASQIFTTRGGYKVTDTLVTAGFAFGTFMCLKVGVLNMGLVGQGLIAGAEPDQMDEKRLEYFKSQHEKLHKQPIPKVRVEAERRGINGGSTAANKEQLGVSSFRASMALSDEDEEERNERLLAVIPPLDAAEMRFVRKMDRGFGARLQDITTFLTMGGIAVVVSLLILAWAEMGKATAILLTCTHFLFAASYIHANLRLRRSRKKILKRYDADVIQAS